jgi:transcriptional regulator with XRE-family HTH domain
VFSDLLRDNQKRAGMTVEQVARRLGVSSAAYREIEAGTWGTWDRICKTFGWQPTFVPANQSHRGRIGRPTRSA